MALPNTGRAQTGTLITASFFNGVLDRIAALQARIAALEDAGPGSPPVEELPTGTLTVFLSQGPGGPLFYSQSYLFVFTVGAQTTQEETYTLSPSIQMAEAEAGWTVVAVGTDGVTPLSPPHLVVPAGTQRLARVRLTTTSFETGGGQLALLVTSQRNPEGLNATSGPIPVGIGTTPGEQG